METDVSYEKDVEHATPRHPSDHIEPQNVTHVPTSGPRESSTDAVTYYPVQVTSNPDPPSEESRYPLLTHTTPERHGST